MFRQESFASSSFLVLMRYSFLISSFICTRLMVSASKMPKYLKVSPSVMILSWFCSSIPSVLCRLPVSITSMAQFFMPNSIPMPRLYILSVCIRLSSSFSFFANSLMSSIYIRWLIFTCDLLSLYPGVHFLIIWLSGIMAIMNSKGDSASPWKIPLWIFVSAKLLPPAVNSTLQAVMVFSMKFMIFRTFWNSLLSSFRNHLSVSHTSVSWWIFTGV